LQALVFGPQRFLGFDVIRVKGDALHGADLNALGFVEVANAFGAFGGVDFVDVLAHVDGLVGAFGFADVAVDAFVGDEQCHVLTGLGLKLQPLLQLVVHRR
jgi:hypothetical protein